MMMAMCSKFGTRGIGVAVAVGDGVNVAVGGTGVEVAEGLSEGVAVGAGIWVQPTSATRIRIIKQDRFTRPPYTCFGVL
jgi:hypothetical protein